MFQLEFSSNIQNVLSAVYYNVYYSNIWPDNTKESNFCNIKVNTGWFNFCKYIFSVASRNLKRKLQSVLSVKMMPHLMFSPNRHCRNSLWGYVKNLQANFSKGSFISWDEFDPIKHRRKPNLPVYCPDSMMPPDVSAIMWQIHVMRDTYRESPKTFDSHHKIPYIWSFRYTKDIK
jgi:hypothetical protein